MPDMEASRSASSLFPTLFLVFLLSLFPSLCAAAIVTVTVPPSIPSNVPQYTNHHSFTSAILNSTNTFRREYNATPVTWNDTLADFATSYLNDRSNCVFAHSGGPYGENIAMGYPNVTASVDAWGDEVGKYDFNDPGFSEATGHFTQLVWQNTTTAGCGARLCGESGWYLVCEYWPRGNVIGEFRDEVDRKVGDGGARLAPPPRLWTFGVLFCAVLFFGSL
jgi:hypothetical protein